MRLSKLIGFILAGGCLVLLALSGLLVSGLLTTMETTEDVSPVPLASNDSAGVINTDPQSDAQGYGVIAQRPLFDPSREPRPPDVPNTGPGGDDDDPPVAEAEPLDVSVNGIIITPDLRLAIVTDNKTNTRMRVREGMPLEEDMAAWTLDSVEPRKLTFTDGDKKRSVVEMNVDAEGAPAAAPATPPQADNGQRRNDDTTEVEVARAEQAEEIRRRVAERRAQLRAEAERRRAEQNKEQ